MMEAYDAAPRGPVELIRENGCCRKVADPSSWWPRTTRFRPARDLANGARNVHRIFTLYPAGATPPVKIRASRRCRLVHDGGQYQRRATNSLSAGSPRTHGICESPWP